MYVVLITCAHMTDMTRKSNNLMESKELYTFGKEPRACFKGIEEILEAESDYFPSNWEFVGTLVERPEAIYQEG